MDHDQHRSGQGGGMGMSYGRFAAMIATSTVVMFGLMYLNTYALSHVEYSQTRCGFRGHRAHHSDLMARGLPI